MEIDFRRLSSTTASDHPDNSDTTGRDARLDFLHDVFDAAGLVDFDGAESLRNQIEMVWSSTLTWSKAMTHMDAIRRSQDIALAAIKRHTDGK